MLYGSRLASMCQSAKTQGLISGDTDWINPLRKMFAHGSDTVLNAPIFLDPFTAVTETIAELIDSAAHPTSR